MENITAIATWVDAAQAAQLLLDHLRQIGDDEEQLTIILANQILAILVTGYETYCEKRFIELIVAGRPLDYARLNRKLVREAKQGAYAGIELAELPHTHAFAKAIIKRYRINFQDYENGKRAYTAAFGLRFGALGLPNQTLQALQTWLRYRHRIIHVSPLLAILNDPASPQEAPVYAGVLVAAAAMEVFNTFISALHAQTLTGDSAKHLCRDDEA